MIIGSLYPLEIGEVVNVHQKNTDTPTVTTRGRVLRTVTREEYIAAREAQGVLAQERLFRHSVVNTATHFYEVSVD